MPFLHTSRAPRFLVPAAVIVTLALAGCSSTDGDSTAGRTTAPTTQAASSPSPSAQAAPFGPACSGLPTDLADKSVATAASQSPALSTLVSAVTAAGLVDTLNSAPNITLFAPTNEAFAKIPPETLNKVLADKKALTSILTYHVVEQRRGPSDLDTGTLKTLQGGTISTAKTGDTYTANDARVVCGNVQTRNATVYLIDTVLMPTS
jgi:uncharacterized surface protein with fasciclin (FAS1) repeats